jgi:hypothetical protein
MVSTTGRGMRRRKRGRCLIGRTKLVRTQEEADEVEHRLVNRGYAESEADCDRRNEVSHGFLGVIQLQNRTVVDDEEPQWLRRCPEVTSLPNSITRSRKSPTCGSETGWVGMSVRISSEIARKKTSEDSCAEPLTRDM